MYSHEIDKTLKLHNYNIKSDTYLEICKTSPQISRIKYEPFQNKFTIWTNDNWNWTFQVELSGIV